MSIVTTTPLPTKVGSPEVCPRCDRTVARARTKAGKVILMDYHPSQLGKYVITGVDGHNNVVSKMARYLDPNDERPRFTCHWDRCRGGSKRRNYGQGPVNYSPFAR